MAVKVERLSGTSGFLRAVAREADPRDEVRIALGKEVPWGQARRTLKDLPRVQVLVDPRANPPAPDTVKGEMRERPWIPQNLALVEPDTILVEVSFGGLVGDHFLLKITDAGTFKYLLYRAWMEAWK